MTPINLDTLPIKLQKRHHNTHSGGLIARLAVDKRYKKQDYGEWLLIDALRKLLFAGETIAFPLVIVDTKKGSIEFYEKFGFIPFQDTPNKLFLTMADIRISLVNAL